MPANACDSSCFVALGVFLVWEVVTRGVAAYLADSSPEKALYLRATEATALLNLAEKKLRDLAPRKVETVAPPHEASRSPITACPRRTPRAEQSDRLSILNASLADSLVGRKGARQRSSQRPRLSHSRTALAQGSDDKQAETFMHAAVRRSLFESEAVYWMMQKSYQAHDYKAAIGYADTLLKTRQNVSGYVMPVLGRIAENQNVPLRLRKFLATNPSWRGFFS